jgi:hypothetical protein
MNKINLNKYNPAVDKKILILMSGLLWMFTGIMLISFTIRWLSASAFKEQALYFSAGILAAIPIRAGFMRLVNKNLKRLLPISGKRCFFSFMTWKSYLIIPVMVAMGITMRHSSMPKQYLSIIYNGIGLGLFLSGIRYLRYFVLLIKVNNQ